MTRQIHLGLFVLCVLAFAGCDDLPTANLDRGGMTFDLQAISDARYPMREMGDAVRRVERCETNQPAQQVALSLDWKWFHRGNTHGIAFRYRYRQSHVGREPRVRMIVRGVGPDRKTLSQRDWKTKIRETGDRWAIFRLEDAGIAGRTTYAQFVIDFADNLGVLEIKDVQGIPNGPVSPARDPAKNAVETRILGVDVIGGDYHLARGCVQGIEFDWRLIGKDVSRKGPWTWVFTMPKGVEIVSTCGAKAGTVERTTDADGRMTVRHGIAGEWLPADRGWKGWKHPAVYVRSDLPSGTDPGEGTFTVLCDGRPVSDPLAFPIRIVEPFAADAVPRRYLNGVIFTGPDTELDDQSGREGYAQTLVDAGVRFMRGVRAPLAEAVEKRTKVVLAGGVSYLSNGFIVNTQPNTSDRRPVDQRFVADDPKYKPDLIRNATCPIAVYNEESYFRDYFLPGFKKQFKGRRLDILEANWEPNPFYGHGCMCANCRAAFARYAKIPEAELAATWPGCVTPTGRYARIAMPFRAREHGRLVKTLARHLQEITGPGTIGFVPGIVWTTMTGEMPEDPLAGEVDPKEYASALKCLCPWGPYAWWYADRPYFHEKRIPLAVWAGAKTVRAFVDRTYGKDVCLWDLVSGRQGECWESVPEWIGLGMDSYFFNRWSITSVYFMPNGYDARWWRVFAESVTRSARYEGYVLDGVRTDEQVSVETVPEYAVPCPMVTAYLPNATNVSPLAIAAYDLKDSRIVAALNFWDGGEAFFTLRCRGLKPGSYTILSDRRTLWVKADGSDRYTSEELARGVFVQVGALRTKVFEIRPADAPLAARDKVDSTAVKESYERARERLRSAAEKDREDEKGRTILVPDGLPVI